MSSLSDLGKMRLSKILHAERFSEDPLAISLEEEAEIRAALALVHAIPGELPI